MKKVILIITILIVIINSNSQVTQEWLARYSVGYYSTVSCIGTDPSGNVFIGGSTANDYLTVKYNSSGIQQWAVTYNGPPGYGDYIYALAIDISGNVYVTGTSNGGYPSPNDDYTTIKYNSSGVQQWLVRYNGIANDRDNALAICLDASGNIYVTGWSYVTTAAGMTDYATVKYNSTGVQQWATRYNGTGNNSDYANAICTDNNGYIYVTGASNSSSNYNSTDYATIKYNTSGGQQWVSRYNGAANLRDEAIAIAVDNLGNVYVTGGSQASSSNTDILTIKYNSSGGILWSQRFDGGYDNPGGLRLDNAGNVYISGTSNSKYVTIKYNTTGAQQWIMYYNGPMNQGSQVTDMVVDANGNTYVTGSSDGEYATVKYNTSGVQQWVMRFDEPRPNMNASGFAIALDSTSNIIVSGISQQESLTDIGTIKYSQLVGILPVSNEIPQQYSLTQNYPNPFNPTTTIKFQIPTGGFVKLIIFDVLGREVSTLVNEELKPGKYEASWEASAYSSGIYYYKLISIDYTETKKMILIK